MSSIEVLDGSLLARQPLEPGKRLSSLVARSVVGSVEGEVQRQA